MELSFDQYPVFQANQVLTSRSLNDDFNYLDEQTRLTRANLIGIGIVCGLEIKLGSPGSAIALSRGCGVTSQGYLIIEPEDVSLVAYRPYALPQDVDYSPFKDPNRPYMIWELFTKGEPNTSPLDSPAGFLDDKAVVLFLELKKEDLRNCSPNNCDDKGAKITVTLRRLLIQIANMDKIIAAANKLGTGLTTGELADALAAKLNLPDLALLRFDVLNTNVSSSNDVYAGFLNVFQTAALAKATGNALRAAYTAFQPLLQAAYPANPFANFDGLFGFLDTAPATTVQVRFLQYYVDLFEDLLHAYDEFRWKGLELVCACCPPDGLFPRHLMLGLLHPEKSAQAGQYREIFRPSPAVGCCAADTRTLLQLFSRLVEMVARFTNAPSLPRILGQPRIDPQIRVTPSVLGDMPLEKKAIPFYYLQDGTPPLYQLWNRQKTLRNRANQNLGYRFDEYNPVAPAFVSDPLRYDLEPQNFLRIEGHLGKNYQRVLNTLLLIKSQYRLPIDIIALRTGAYDDSQPVDLSRESARFQDLEVLYDTIREELLSSLAAGIMDLYDVLIPDNTLTEGTPKLPLLQKYGPNYRYPKASVGAVYEQHLASFQAIPYIDIDQTLISDARFGEQVLKVHCILFANAADVPADRRPHVVSIFYFSKLSEVLPATLDALAYADFENRYQDLLALVRFFRNDITAHVPADLKTFVPQAELIDQFDEVLFNCRMDAVKAVHDEYARRMGELKKKQFLSNFLLQHPGIQHKAGVTLGGTFLVVYHGEPATALSVDGTIVSNTVAFAGAFGVQNVLKVDKSVTSATFLKAGAEDIAIKTAQTSEAIKATDVNKLALTDAINRISGNQSLSGNPDIKLVINSLTGKIPLDLQTPVPAFDDQRSRIIATAVGELDNGTVIADFFLPYRVSSDFPGIEFVLPKIPPVFTAKASCTTPEGNAQVKVKVKGGTAPYDIAVDEGGFDALGASLILAAGTHALKVRDAQGIESAPQTIKIPNAISIDAVQYDCQEGKFTATFTTAGGTPPYTVNGKAVAGTKFTTDLVASGAQLTIEVLDSLKCSFKTSLTHECCNLPCNGISKRRGYRFWLPEPDLQAQHLYENFTPGAISFVVDTEQGKQPADLSDNVQPVIKAEVQGLNNNATFAKVVNSWLGQINKLIMADARLNGGGKASWLTLSYESKGPGRLGTLWIEHFECLDFSIKITSAFTLTTGGARSLSASYNATGTTIQINEGTAVKVPAFDGQQIDKCNPDKPVVTLCAQAELPKLSIMIVKTPPQVLPKETQEAVSGLRKSSIAGTPQQGLDITFEVKPVPDSNGLEFLWEVQDATPAMGNGRTFKTVLPNNNVLVTVTAYTKGGCSVTTSTRIEGGLQSDVATDKQPDVTK